MQYDQAYHRLKIRRLWHRIFLQAENPFRLLLAKGMTINGFGPRVYLLHVRYHGDWKELYFRDYLMAHPAVAREYGELKQRSFQILKKA